MSAEYKICPLCPPSEPTEPCRIYLYLQAEVSQDEDSMNMTYARLSNPDDDQARPSPNRQHSTSSSRSTATDLWQRTSITTTSSTPTTTLIDVKLCPFHWNASIVWRDVSSPLPLRPRPLTDETSLDLSRLAKIFQPRLNDRNVAAGEIARWGARMVIRRWKEGERARGLGLEAQEEDAGWDHDGVWASEDDNEWEDQDDGNIEQANVDSTTVDELLAKEMKSLDLKVKKATVESGAVDLVDSMGALGISVGMKDANRVQELTGDTTGVVPRASERESHSQVDSERGRRVKDDCKVQ